MERGVVIQGPWQGKPEAITGLPLAETALLDKARLGLCHGFIGVVQGSSLLGLFLGLEQTLLTRLNKACGESLALKPLLWLFSRNVGQTQKPSFFGAWDRLLTLILPSIGLFVWMLAFVTATSTGKIAAIGLALGAYTAVLAAISGRLHWLKKLSTVDWLVFAYFVLQVVSAAFSSWQHESLVGLSKTFTFFVGFLTFRSLFNLRPALMKVWFASLFLAGLSQAAVAGWQTIVGVNPLATWSDTTVNAELQINRVYGTIQPLNPNLLAGFLLAALPSAGWLALHALPDFSCLSKRWPVAALLLTGAVGMVWALVQTGSRGGYLSLLGSGALALFLGVLLTGLWLEAKQNHSAETKPESSLKQKLTSWGVLAGIPLGLTLVLGVAFMKVASLRQRLASIFAMREDSSISYRLNVYDSCMQMAADNWATGIGPGNSVFKQIYGLYMKPGFNALGCYSVPLEVATELGFSGVVVMLALAWAVAAGTLSRLFSFGVQQRQRLLGACLLLALSLFVGQGLFDTVWYRPAVQLCFWAWAAAWLQWCSTAHQGLEAKPAPMRVV
jgi:putative inorganic carbon (hco3(-)) transporter